MGTPLIIINNKILHYPPKSQQYSNGSSPMRGLTRLRLPNFNFTNTIIKQNPYFISRIKPVSLTRSAVMAEGAEKRETGVVGCEEREGNTPPQVKEISPPTPPEKPEAGDCCGSGCVRCVWDVYYEELEAYDQLLKQFNSQQTDNHNKNTA